MRRAFKAISLSPRASSWSRTLPGMGRTPISSTSTARCCAIPTGFTYNSFASSIQRVTGFEVTLDGVSVHGSTDTAILRDACSQAGIPAEVLEAAGGPPFMEAMCQTVAEQRHELKLRLMPGVEDALRHLARKGALLGVATGNLKAIG
jgi:phosphoglycolate phosphatase-like HAD superfamily hydrolase